MTTSKRGDDQNYFGTTFWQIGNAWKRNAASVLRPENVTYVQFMVLKTIHTLKSSQRIISQIEIATALHANPMVISSVTRSLKKQKLVTARIHPKDSRAKRIDLTEAGESVLKITHDLIMEMERDFFKPIGEYDTVISQKLAELANAHPFTLDA